MNFRHPCVSRAWFNDPYQAGNPAAVFVRVLLGSCAVHKFVWRSGAQASTQTAQLCNGCSSVSIDVNEIERRENHKRGGLIEIWKLLQNPPIYHHGHGLYKMAILGDDIYHSQNHNIFSLISMVFFWDEGVVWAYNLPSFASLFYCYFCF